MAIFQRNGADFKEKLLKQLMDEVKQSVQDLLEVAHNSTGNVTSELVSCSAASRAAVRIHLFTLLFEDCNRLCVRLVEEASVVELMVRLVSAAQEALAVYQLAATHVTPKWVTPMLLFIDLYEKVVLGMKRRAAMAEVASHNWKWFDISSGKWCAYTGVNNKTIDDAYWAGDASVKVTTGRRRYNIQFGAMVQANEETGNRRPIMISLKEKPKEAKKGEEKSANKSPMEDDAKKKTEDESNHF
jgi:E3 ubiquitin-protein ligase HUWE1